MGIVWKEIGSGGSGGETDPVISLDMISNKTARSNSTSGSSMYNATDTMIFKNNNVSKLTLGVSRSVSTTTTGAITATVTVYGLETPEDSGTRIDSITPGTPDTVFNREFSLANDTGVYPYVKIVSAFNCNSPSHTGNLSIASMVLE